ncbi:mCG67504, isoform CRA_c [Mus musculus]|nr:mCG67504, isoform CRA_c [Mus musculus]
MPVGILLFLLLANFLPRTSNSLLNRNISRRWYPRLPVHLWAFMGVLYRQEVCSLFGPPSTTVFLMKRH